MNLASAMLGVAHIARLYHASHRTEPEVAENVWIAERSQISMSCHGGLTGNSEVDMVTAVTSTRRLWYEIESHSVLDSSKQASKLLCWRFTGAAA